MNQQQAREYRLNKFYDPDLVRQLNENFESSMSNGSHFFTSSGFEDADDFIRTTTFIRDYFEYYGWDVDIKPQMLGGTLSRPVPSYETYVEVTLTPKGES